jgi:hypothetical protein
MKTFVKDTLERTGRTFVGTFAASLLTSQTDFTDLSAVQSAGMAGYAAAATVLLSLLASRFGDRDTAGFTRT